MKGLNGLFSNPLRTGLIGALLGLAFIAAVGTSQASLAPPYVDIFNFSEKATNLADTIPYDWANSGACTYNTSPISCAGSEGLFNGGTFINATTPPTPPTLTATAAADPKIIGSAFISDALSPDVTSCGTGDPSIFEGGNKNKNGSTISTMTFKTGSVSNKSDLLNVAAVQVRDASPRNEVYIMAERNFTSGQGDTHIDFELTQALITRDTGCTGSFAGNRTGGDLLIAVDFANGGTIGEKRLYEWMCTVPAVKNGTGPYIAPAGVCNPPLPGAPHIQSEQDVAGAKDIGAPAYYQISGGSDVVFGVNGAAIPCGGWACRAANGTQINTIDANKFMEGGVDLFELGFGGCFATIWPHTRASTSVASVLEDSAGPSRLSSCDTSLRTKLSTDAAVACPVDATSALTVNVGTTVYDKACLTVQAGSTATGTATYKIYNENTCTTLATVAQIDGIGDSPQSTWTVNLGSGNSIPTISFIPLQPGTYYVGVRYNGDATNVASQAACTTEVLTVNQPTSVATCLHQRTSAAGTADVDPANNCTAQSAEITVPAGSYVNDVITVTPSTATGTVQIKRYDSLAKCDADDDGTDTGTGIVVVDASKTVTSGSATSSTFQFNDVGTWFWRAFFTGSTSFILNSVSDCSEKLTITPVETAISSAPWIYPNDKATISAPNGGGNLAGNITFRLYGATNGTTALQNCQADSAETATVGNGGLLYAPASQAVAGAGPLTFNTSNTTVKVEASATVYWRVTFTSTNPNQTGRKSSCVENINVTLNGDGGPGAAYSP